MSENFRRNWRKRAELLAEAWQLTNIKWLDHESTAVVAECVSPFGPAILKVSLLDFVIASEAETLKRYGKDIFPDLFQFSEEHQALLIERVVPGGQLAEIYPNAETEIAVFCDIFESMRRCRVSSDGLPRIYDFADIFARMSDRTDDEEQLAILRQALEWREFLAGDELLHGDLHHFNILQDGDCWRAIDPHGFVGNPLYELGAFLRNPIPQSWEGPEMKHRLRQRVALLSQRLGIPSSEVARFGFFGCAFSIAWDLDEGLPSKGMPSLATACLELHQEFLV